MLPMVKLKGWTTRRRRRKRKGWGKRRSCRVS
jgi:hypothetical protein